MSNDLDILGRIKLVDMNKQRKGWYHVSMTFSRAYFGDREYITMKATSPGEVIAESGMDAYTLAIKNLHNDMSILPDSIYPEPLSDDFSFEFLGAKTDDGYSVEVWNKWKKEGKI